MNGHRINDFRRHRLLGFVPVFDFPVQIRIHEHLRERPVNIFSYFRMKTIKIHPLMDINVWISQKLFTYKNEGVSK